MYRIMRMEYEVTGRCVQSFSVFVFRVIVVELQEQSRFLSFHCKCPGRMSGKFDIDLVYFCSWVYFSKTFQRVFEVWHFQAQSSAMTESVVFVFPMRVVFSV